MRRRFSPSTPWSLTYSPLEYSVPHPLPTFHSAQALYFARRLLSPITSSIHAFESRSRRQRPLSNDSGPLTFFNAAHICAAIEDGFSLPFPSFIRLRMALAAESFASSTPN